jgi:hypothetical protein
LPDFMVIVFCPAINQRLQSFKAVSQSCALTGCFNLLEAVQPIVEALAQFYSFIVSANSIH